MVASITSPADALNAALRMLGRSERVGNLYDGSEPAKAALDLYGQTRDALLRSKSWLFAQQNVILEEDRHGPPPGWSYAYTWPENALMVRAVIPNPIPTPNLNPIDLLFTPYNAPLSGNRVILANYNPAMAVITAQITDLTQWDVGSVSALIGALADALKAQLARDPNLIKILEGDAAQSLAEAVGADELQPPTDLAPRAA